MEPTKLVVPHGKLVHSVRPTSDVDLRYVDAVQPDTEPWFSMVQAPIRFLVRSRQSQSGDQLPSKLLCFSGLGLS